MDAATVEAVAAEIVCRGQAIGAACRVAALSPNIPGGYLYTLLDHAGSAMVLAHDAFEAARWFIGVEYGDMVVPWDGITIKLRRDADIVDEDYDRREADYRGTYRWAMIDIRRAELARGRAEFLRALRTRQLPGDVV